MAVKRVLILILAVSYSKLVNLAVLRNRSPSEVGVGAEKDIYDLLKYANQFGMPLPGFFGQEVDDLTRSEFDNLPVNGTESESWA